MLLLSDTVFENAIKSAELSEGSIISYLKQLRMAKELFGQKTYHQILSKPEAAKRLFEDAVSNETISLNTARTIVTCLVSLFKHAENAGQLSNTAEVKQLHDEWTTILGIFNERVSYISEKNLFSKRERQGYVDYDEWAEKEQELRNSEPGSLRHLLVAFHTLVTPLRGGDLAVVTIVPPTSPLAKETSPSKENVLVWAGEDKPSKLLIRDHKTRTSYPVLTRDLPLPLRRAIALSLKEHPRELLFVDSNDKKWVRNSFMTWKSATLRDLFGKPVTTNLARHAYVNATRSNTDSIAEERRRAREMGHSLAMHQKYRRVS